VIKGELGAEANSSCDLGDLALPLSEFFLDEALSLVELDDDNSQQVLFYHSWLKLAGLKNAYLHDYRKMPLGC